MPMVFMLIMTGWAMMINIEQFFQEQNWLLVFIGISVFALEIWMLIESFFVFKQALFDRLVAVEEAECD